MLCFSVIFWAKSTVGIRGQVVNAMDKMQAKAITEWESELLAEQR
jgi:hypothetical protein